MNTLGVINTASRKLWGLGWALFYVIVLYLCAADAIFIPANKWQWITWVAPVCGGVISTLAISTRGTSQQGFFRSGLLAVHFLNLAFAIVVLVIFILAWLVQV